MGILSFITDAFAFFLDSLTAIENVLGIYNFNLGGLIIEHPLAFILLLPLFFLAFYIGLRHSRLGFFSTLVGICIVSVGFIIVVGFGIEPSIVVNFAFFLFTLPITFLIGFFIGWGFQHLLRVICTDRTGGLFCRIEF